MNGKQSHTGKKPSGRELRRGAAAVEGAVVMAAFLLILFGMLDLGLLVLDHNTLSEAARRLAREAMVHGQMAAPQRTVWGPATITGTAADTTEYAFCLRKELATFDPGSVSFSLEWPDATNRPDDHVRVTVNYQYQPILPYLLGSNGVGLRAVSTMLVGH